MTEKKWYAVYTMPRWEKKVAERLTKSKIENYCPLNRVVRQWADRKKIVQEPLFTSYVFVHVNEQEHVTIRKTDGIINFVYWLGKPAVIRDEEIETIHRFLVEYPNVTIEKTKVSVNDAVRIINGPLLQQEGKIVAIKNKTIRVLLPSMGYMMIAEMELAKVEIINQAPLFTSTHGQPSSVVRN